MIHFSFRHPFVLVPHLLEFDLVNGFHLIPLLFL